MVSGESVYVESAGVRCDAEVGRKVRREEESMSSQLEDCSRRDLDHEIARGGWALLFIMTGGLLLLPDVPSGTWLIGIGVILLGARSHSLLPRLVANRRDG